MDVLGANRFRSSAAPTSSRALLGPAVGIEPTSAKGFLAALPLKCDSLASCNQNLSRASEFREHSGCSDCGARPAVRSGRADRTRSVQARIAFSYGVRCSGSSFSKRRPNCDCNCRRR